MCRYTLEEQITMHKVDHEATQGRLLSSELRVEGALRDNATLRVGSHSLPGGC